MPVSVLSPIVVPPAFLSRPSGGRPPKVSLGRYLTSSYEACPAPGVSRGNATPKLTAPQKEQKMPQSTLDKVIADVQALSPEE